MDPLISSPGNMTTKLLSWNTVLEKIVVELNKSAKFIDLFASLETNPERVLICFTNDTVSKFIQEYLTICKGALGRGRKVLSRATSLRLAGNDALAKKQIGEALKIYTMALTFAPEDSEAPLLYGNRSAAFYQLEQYENAIEDIERAFKLDYARLKPDGKGKLLIRKADCLLRLGRNEEVKSLFACAQNEAPKDARWEQLKSLSTLTNRTVVKREVNLSKFQDSATVIQALIEKKKFTPHERFSWLNGKVDAHYDTENGFKFISKEKLEFGEVAFVGKPFVSLFGFLKDMASLNDNLLENDIQESPVCHYCLAGCINSIVRSQIGTRHEAERALEIQQLSSGPCRVNAPLPCTKCSNAIYCSEYCRTEAWNSFHQFECDQFAILTAGDLTQPLLSLRMLYSAGSLERIKQVANEWEYVQDRLEMLKNPRDYAFIYSIRQTKERDLQEDLRMTVTACFLAKLTQMSGFVLNSTKDELFAAGILLRHQLQVKAHRFIEHGRNEQTGLISQVHGIYGLLAHSCNFNIRTYDISWNTNVIQSNVKIIYACRPIEANSELNPAYGFGLPLDMPPDSMGFECTRHLADYFFKMFRFTCKCSRCLQERRDALNGPTGVYYPIACSSCGSLMIRPENGPLADSYQCSSTSGCNMKMTGNQMKAAYSKVDQVVNLQRDARASLTRPILDTLASRNIFKKLKQSFSVLGPLLHGGSPFLAHLYDRLFELMFHKLQTLTVFSVSTPDEHRDAVSEFLPDGWVYLEKQVQVFEKRVGGSLEDNMDVAGMMLASFTVFTLCDLQQHIEMATFMGKPKLAKIFLRLQTVKRMIEFDRVITSPSN